MIPYTDYTVRLGDLKRAIVENPYDPNLNIDGYMRYLKYNTPSAQPEIIRCRDCAKREYCRTSTVWAVAPNDDWYCADAGRREENE